MCLRAFRKRSALENKEIKDRPETLILLQNWVESVTHRDRRCEPQGSRTSRVLAVVDDFSREGLALVADTSLSGRRVTRELDALLVIRGRPVTIVF